MKHRETVWKTVRGALAVIIAHAAVTAVHGAAHEILDVRNSVAQNFFIALVIVSAPLVAGLLLLRGLKRAGAVLLACSMAGALVFGIYNHFIAISADHVRHVASATHPTWVSVFQLTAVLIALIEAFGLWAGIRLWQKR